MINRVLILNFPKITPDAPPLAPALLAAICQRNNVYSNFVDINADFWTRIPLELQQELLHDFPENFIDFLSEPAQQWMHEYFYDLQIKYKDYDRIPII